MTLKSNNSHLRVRWEPIKQDRLKPVAVMNFKTPRTDMTATLTVWRFFYAKIFAKMTKILANYETFCRILRLLG